MITAPIAPLVRGAADLETTARGLRPHRLPESVRTRFPDPYLLAMEGRPAGVRLAMTTAARSLRLVLHATYVDYRGAARPRGAVDLVVDGEPVASRTLGGGDRIETDLETGAGVLHPGEEDAVAFFGLAPGEKRVELWLPHDEAVELVELRADAPVRTAEAEGPVWVHHGSSISQGSNAASPTRTWPAIAARLGGAELRSLGFGGNAFADPFTARVIRDAEADLVSVKLGVNVVGLDGMRLRTFVPAVDGFLDTIREGHPTAPLILVSPIFCGIHEETPGPGAVDTATLGTGRVAFTATGVDDGNGRLTLRLVRDALASLAERRADDPNLHYLDGTALYGEKDAEDLPLPDALHPDTAAHRRIGERFAAYAFGRSGPFAQH